MRRMVGLGGLCLSLLFACGSDGDTVDRTSGNLCGITGVVGETRAPIKSGACGIAKPVAVTRVAGVNLSRPALMTCENARALNYWVRTGVLPATGKRGGGLSSMTVAAHYACRTRNSRKGARLSEHAKGNAIDLSAFTFADGSGVSVLKGWNGAPKDRELLRKMHGAACGPYGTVLGPNSDRFHRDHFHFDVAGYRSGPYCR